MRIVELPRRGGKTTYMLSWLAGHPDRILVTFSEMEADRLRRKVRQEGALRFVLPGEPEPPIAIDPDRIYSVSEIRRAGIWGRGFVEVGVDNAEMVFSYLLGGRPIAVITVTR